MNMRRILRPALLGLALAFALMPAQRAAAETCSAESFGEAVDESAAELRAFSAETQPRLKQKLQALRDHKKWTDPDFEAKGLALVHDKKLDEFDAQAGELLGKIDTLGTPETEAAAAGSCANLSELKAASSELMAVMRAKSAYLIAKIDKEIGAPAAAAPSTVASSEPVPAPTPAAPPQSASHEPASPPSASPPAASADAQPEKPAGPASPVRKTETAKTEPPKTETTKPGATSPPPTSAPAAASRSKEETEKSSSWSTTTAQAVIPPPPVVRTPSPNHDLPPAFEPPAPGDPPGAPYALPPGDGIPHAQDGYTIDEIRAATQGFFGTISTSLASVIEHAFKQAGRPTAYVLGKEGGGAFLAGLRYGEGTLYLRTGGTQQVFWHGPSIGYDVGAEGSRTLFLIYNLDEANSLFRRFTGVDGSAYLVGGVGMTLLKGGPVLMAPIRSGLGLRLGASIGYVRFTPRPTWNPF